MSDTHIYYQNKAVIDFEALALAPWRAGAISGEQAIAELERIASAFESYAYGLNNSRAAAGARDIRNLADTLKRSIYTGASFPPSDIPVAGGGGPMVGGGGTIPIGGSSLPPRPSVPDLGSKGWLVVGALVFFLLMGGTKK